MEVKWTMELRMELRRVSDYLDLNSLVGDAWPIIINFFFCPGG